jgi:hypothetical protein
MCRGVLKDRHHVTIRAELYSKWTRDDPPSNHISSHQALPSTCKISLNEDPLAGYDPMILYQRLLSPSVGICPYRRARHNISRMVRRCMDVECQAWFISLIQRPRIDAAGDSLRP